MASIPRTAQHPVTFAVYARRAARYRKQAGIAQRNSNDTRRSPEDRAEMARLAQQFAGLAERALADGRQQDPDGARMFEVGL